jgi:hypothetical protein
VLTSNGGAAINFTGSGSNVENNVLFTDAISDPTTEARPNQIGTTCTATTGNNTEACIPLVSITSINPSIYTWGNGSGGSIDSPGFYGGGNSNNTTIWSSGCTPGSTCPGVTNYAVGTEGYAWNAGSGELVNALSFLIHGVSAPPAHAAVDRWVGLYDNGGCNSGIMASACYGLLIGVKSSDYSGFGSTTPMAMLHARGGNTTVTANVYISGTTMCFASTPSGNILPYAAVTGSGISANTHYLTYASADIPNGNMCATVDVSQTAGSVGSPVSASFANSFSDFLAQNYSVGGFAGMTYIIGNTGNAPSGRDGMEYDSSIPLGGYWNLNLAGTDIAYGFSPGGSRAGGLAIGYTSIVGTPVNYSLTVGTSGLNSDGGYYAGGTAGVTCSSQNVSSVNGIVTACGGGRTPSTNIVQFFALAKAASATVVAGGATYSTTQTITLTGGTCSTFPVLSVATVSGSAVATVTVSTAGSCTVLPTAPTAQGSTSGSGTGATFQVTWTGIAQTYTPTSGISTVDFYAQGPGGSGGGGALQATSTGVSGGAGGGGGSCNIATLTPTQIGASQSVTIGLPGLQGTPATSNTTAGGNAGSGSTTLLGTLLGGVAGGGGAGGQLAATSGGGGGSAGSSGGNASGATGGGAGAAGGGIGGTGIGGGAPSSPYAGAGGGGGGATGTGGAGGLGMAGVGGGAGGGDTAANAAQVGASGGNEVAAGRLVSGGTGGAANTGGNAGANQTTPQFCQAAGSGGGGGGGSSGSGSAGAGATGANGSGGGGGGSGQNSGVAGWGGLGGPGVMTVVEHF